VKNAQLAVLEEELMLIAVVESLRIIKTGDDGLSL